jgi:hypothetical protein
MVSSKCEDTHALTQEAEDTFTKGTSLASHATTHGVGSIRWPEDYSTQQIHALLAAAYPDPGRQRRSQQRPLLRDAATELARVRRGCGALHEAVI